MICDIVHAEEPFFDVDEHLGEELLAEARQKPTKPQQKHVVRRFSKGSRSKAGKQDQAAGAEDEAIEVTSIKPILAKLFENLNHACIIC